MESTRRILIAGNWKMNGLRADALRWARSAVEAARLNPHEVALFPPFPWIEAVGAEIVSVMASAIRNRRSGCLVGVGPSA